MTKRALLILLVCGSLGATTLDKGRILAIIKAAKQHQSISDDVNVPPVIFKKSEKTRKAKKETLLHGSLPSLVPYGMLLKKRYDNRHKKKKMKKPILFKAPKQNHTNKTTATKIDFY